MVKSDSRWKTILQPINYQLFKIKIRFPQTKNPFILKGLILLL